MPHLPSPKPPPAAWPLTLSAACGNGKNDFYALGHSSEFDAAFEATNARTLVSPLSRFTHVLHFKNGRRNRVDCVPDRLLRTWWSRDRQIAYAVGFPRAVFEIGSAGIDEVILDAHEGVFFGLWGTAGDELFACGFRPFALRRHAGRWHDLALSTLPTDRLHAVGGGDAANVFFVGGQGTILHFDGTALKPLEVPTTRDLLSVAALGGGRFCVGGAGGILLYGNRAGWRIVASRVDEDILHLASFRDRVYYATLDGLYAFDGMQAPRLVLDLPCDSVSSLGDAVVIAHESRAWLYDGAELVALDTAV
jgi:hypothetical protein